MRIPTAALAMTLILVLSANGIARAEDIAEQEPNEDHATASQVILPGNTIRGRLETQADIDCFVLTSEKDRILTFRFLVDAGKRFGSIRLRGIRKSGMGPKRRFVPLIRQFVPAGRHTIEIGAYRSMAPYDYEFEIIEEVDEPGLEVERADVAAAAPRLILDLDHTGWLSHEFSDVDFLRFTAEERGIYRVTIERLDPPEVPMGPWTPSGSDQPVSLSLNIKPGFDEGPYNYTADQLDREYRFFPVLEKGDHLFRISPGRGAIGGAYHLRVERFKVEVPPTLEKAAREAVRRGDEWLIQSKGTTGAGRNRRALAHSMTILALAEGDEGKGLSPVSAARIEAALDGLEELRHVAKDGLWNGEPVLRYSSNAYESAIAALALAEAAGRGNDRAREMAKEAITYLLATQLTHLRCEAWNTIEQTDLEHGGWRYSPNSKQGDISVAGWSLIALFAAGVAGIEVDGMLDALDWVVSYVGRCTDNVRGFIYQPAVGGGRSTNVQQSIGALITELLGVRSPALKVALHDLDHHMCAGTQTGYGENTPFYYWYYATRVNFIRGGYHWEAWRAITMEQLVRRQNEDGSWDDIRNEKKAGPQYPTALGVLILRLCLNQPPPYLDQEVDGF